MLRSPLLALLLLVGSTPAQESSNYKLNDHVFNAGGHPATDGMLQSATFRMTLDALGEVAGDVVLSGASYRMHAGFVPCFRPPREVTGLTFDDARTLTWQPEGSGGPYRLYRDRLSELPGQNYGVCEQSQITVESTIDDHVPLPGEASFYLVTAGNLLGEEGSKGATSDGTPREGTVCP